MSQSSVDNVSFAPIDHSGVPANCPRTDYDIYDESNLLNPYPGFKTLRDLGGVVYLNRYGIYALPRHETTEKALKDWETFSSAKGVMLNETMNKFMEGVLLCSDPPEHDLKRELIMRPLSPKGLHKIKAEVEEEAFRLIDQLLERGEFNAATDFAQHLPLTIVARKVGLPAAEREQMLRWSGNAFNANGPIEKERTRKAFPVLEEIGGFIKSADKRETVDPSSWLAALYGAVEEGKIDEETAGAMSFDYVAPALDTTISASAGAIYLFAKFPEQWKRLMESPQLIPNAINEIVRWVSPNQGWTRYVTKDVEMDGVVIPKGARVLVMFACSGRDERRWESPDEFDVTRKLAGHLGFGAGEHTCAGANLARLEMSSLLRALLDRGVTGFELLEEPEMVVNNMAKVWGRVMVRVRKD